jgi:hypothetical protein
MVTSIT